MLRPTALALATAAALAGCGSQDDPRAYPPPAGPAVSPVPAAPPEGRVVALGGEPVALAVDQDAGVLAVTLRDPDETVHVDVRTLEVLRRSPARDAASAPPRIAVRRRARELVVRGDGGEQRAPAGVGPTTAAEGADGRVYVADTDGDAVLLFRTRPEVALARRYGLPGAPYATTVDREKGKLWVTLTETNEVAQLTADGQPREQRRYASVRQPDAVAVHEATGRVFVAGRRDGTLQAFSGYPEG